MSDSRTNLSKRKKFKELQDLARETIGLDRMHTVAMGQGQEQQMLNTLQRYLLFLNVRVGAFLLL